MQRPDKSGDEAKSLHEQPADQRGPADLLSLKSSASERHENKCLHSPKPLLSSATDTHKPTKHTSDAVTQIVQLEAHPSICASYVEMLGSSPLITTTSQLLSRHHSRSKQSRRRAATHDSSNVQLSSASSWEKSGLVESCRCDTSVCQRPAIESRPLGFTTATRLTATVAPSPVRFNMPLIMPHASASNYYGSRQAHAAYYPYQAPNVFAYSVGGYVPSAKPFQPSSWSTMSEMSQYSYQPTVLAASFCPLGVGRGMQQSSQSPHVLRSGFATQPPYQNVQPAHTSLALYPAAFGVIAPSAAVLPPSHVIDASAAARNYDQPRCFAASDSMRSSSVGVESKASATVLPLCAPVAKLKSHSSGTSSYNASNMQQPAHLPYSSAAAFANCDSAAAHVADRRDGNVATTATVTTPITAAAAAIIQPYGFYGSAPASFGITGQIHSFPVGKCCSFISYALYLFKL